MRPRRRDPSADEPRRRQKTAPPASGGVNAGEGSGEAAAEPEVEEEAAAPEGSAGALAIPSPSAAFAIPSLPASACSTSGVPPILIPMYQRAAAAYGLGPQGPAVLAGINEIETAFGTNLNVSSAGALGWMQFMPATWDAYGVDANGDGVADPYNPEDAIYSAANYLSASGMPADTYGAIFAYNHADWYVAEVLANASCHAAAVGVPSLGAGLGPQIQVLKCSPPRPGGSGSRTSTCEPSRTPRRATNSASAASGRWPRSPASSRTSVAA